MKYANRQTGGILLEENYYKENFIKRENYYLPDISKLSKLYNDTNQLIKQNKKCNKKIILPIPSTLYYLLSLPEKSIKEKIMIKNPTNKIEKILNSLREIIETNISMKKK
jgi:hypothetical protein